jgi:hypothetical protein
MDLTVGGLLTACITIAMEAREVGWMTLAVAPGVSLARPFAAGPFRHMVDVRSIPAVSIARVPTAPVRGKLRPGKVVAMPMTGPAEAAPVMGKAVVRPVVSATSEFTRPRPVVPPGVETVVAITSEREFAEPRDGMSMPREIRPRAASFGAMRTGTVVAVSGEIAVMTSVTMRRVLVVWTLAVPFSGLLTVMLSRMGVVALVGFLGCLGVAFVRLLFLGVTLVGASVQLALVRFVGSQNIRRGRASVGAFLAAPAALAIATSLRTLQLALERLARELLPRGLLLGSQHALQLFIGGFASGAELFAIAATILKRRAHLFTRRRLDLFHLLLLLVRQAERTGHFRIVQGA